MHLKTLEKLTKMIHAFSFDEELYINSLIKKDILKQNDDEIIFNKKYKVGIVKFIKTDIKIFPLDENSKSISINSENLMGASNGDAVIVKIIFNPRGKLKCKVVEIVKKNDSLILCYIKDNKIFDVKNSTPLTLNISTKELTDEDIFLLKDNIIQEVFGNISQSSIDEKISLYLYTQEYRAKEQIKHKIEEIKDYSSRVDLTALEFCTIDPVSAKDHDDAIYYDESDTTLYVAIADVSAYVKEGTLLDEEAKKRAFSIYLPNKVLPMIPFELSANLCSLKPNVKRLSYVLKMKLDIKKLTVIDSELIEAVIISKHKYSYEQIDEQIKSDTLPISLKLLYSLTTKFRKKRLNTGYNFRTKECRLMLDKNEKLMFVNVEEGSPSHKLVEECMLLANCQAAARLGKYGIYRVHEEPNRKKLEDLIRSVELLGIKAKLKEDVHSTILSIQKKAEAVNLTEQVDKLIIQSQQQAKYTSVINAHFGLGFSSYSHFTSPIRRYSDLVLHRMLKASQVPKDIDEVCEYISNVERDIARLVWDLEDRKYARWAYDNIDKVYEAIIVDVDDEPKGELSADMIGLRFDIENYESEQLFSKINVKISSVNRITKKITVKIVNV